MPEQDHIDRFLERFGSRLTGVDLVVEGIVDRIGGLNRRLHREMDETLEDFAVNFGEYKVLGALWRLARRTGFHRASLRGSRSSRPAR